MKIAVFTDSYYPHVSGVTTTVDKQIQKLAEMGHRIKLFCPKFKKQSRAGQDLPKNIDIIRLPANVPFPGYSTFSVSIPTVTKSLKEIRKFRPDIIHIHTEGGVGWEGLICAKIRKIPIITTLHTFLAHQEYLKHWKIDKFESFQKIAWKYILMIHNQAKLVICPSLAMKKEAVENGLEVNAKVIANGIDLSEYSKVAKASPDKTSENKFHFIYVGRVAVEKSLPVLIKAFKIIAKKQPKTKLTIIGDGPALAGLREMVNHQHLAGQVIFTGQIPHNQLMNSDLISSANTFITPSKTENQPISVLEAMAFGLPLIGVDALGMGELIKHKKNGFLAEPDNHRQIAQYGLKLVNNPQLAGQFGQKSLQMVKQLSLTKTGKELESVYKKTVQQK